LEETLSAAHLRLASTYIERLDWKDCMRRYDRSHTLFYLDPPYWQTEGYGVEFPWDEYVAMAELMRSIKGKAVLSINDHPDVRACFAGLQMDEVPIGYTVGGWRKGRRPDRADHLQLRPDRRACWSVLIERTCGVTPAMRQFRRSSGFLLRKYLIFFVLIRSCSHQAPTAVNAKSNKIKGLGSFLPHLTCSSRVQTIFSRHTMAAETPSDRAMIRLSDGEGREYGKTTAEGFREMGDWAAASVAAWGA